MDLTDQSLSFVEGKIVFSKGYMTVPSCSAQFIKSEVRLATLEGCAALVHCGFGCDDEPGRYVIFIQDLLDAAGALVAWRTVNWFGSFDGFELFLWLSGRREHEDFSALLPQPVSYSSETSLHVVSSACIWVSRSLHCPARTAGAAACLICELAASKQ